MDVWCGCVCSVGVWCMWCVVYVVCGVCVQGAVSHSAPQVSRPVVARCPPLPRPRQGRRCGWPASPGPRQPSAVWWGRRPSA